MRGSFHARWIAIGFLIAAFCALNKMPFETSSAPPTFSPERFFNGHLDSWGVFVGLSGKADERFEMHADASWDGNKGQMHEKFLFADGKTNERHWTFEKTDATHFTGTAPDLEGKALGVVSGDTLHWVYVIDIPVNGTVRGIRFDDWLYRIDDKHIFSEVKASKWGIPVGHMTMFFAKP